MPANGTSQFQLPNVGQTVDGYYDVNRIVTAKNVVKDASKFGKQIDHWNGFDLTGDVRMTQRAATSGRRQQRQDNDRQLRTGR